jgi:hypothetical protein
MRSASVPSIALFDALVPQRFGRSLASVHLQSQTCGEPSNVIQLSTLNVIYPVAVECR